jgi:hypothetical protein
LYDYSTKKIQLVYILCTFLCLVQAYSQNTSKANLEKTSFYTTLDSIKITTQNFDTLAFSKSEFNQLIDSVPSLYDDNFFGAPDINYKSMFKKTFYNDKGEPVLSFNSEVGQDDYFILYAYFLQKKVGDKFNERKKTVTDIYNIINSIYAHLSNGGTYFGHQSRRIIGYAEYSIYNYSKNEDFFNKKYNIKPQKNIYLKSIRQLIKDELTEDGGTVGIDRIKKEKKLNALVDQLSNLITDNFYLKSAQEFQISHY